MVLVLFLYCLIIHGACVIEICIEFSSICVWMIDFYIAHRRVGCGTDNGVPAQLPEPEWCGRKE